MSNSPDPKHILDGYRILDFTQYLAGPTTSRLAVEMGAEVIKVELTPAGDPVHAMPHRRNGYDWRPGATTLLSHARHW